jgi:NAD dependent epimerase/dehydratase family enzyme
MTDMVRAVRFLIENTDARGPFNLVAPNPVTNAQLGRTIGRVMRRPYYMPVPGPALRAAFGEVSTVVLDGQRVMPRHLAELGFQFKFPEAEEALRDILGENGRRSLPT